MVESKNYQKISRYISYLLRHCPDEGNLEMDEHGWVDVDRLINHLRKTYRDFCKKYLDEIVRSDNKQRYSFNSDYTKIRANQGHSIEVDLQLINQKPPKYLYHGTGIKYVDSIEKNGICKQSRQYVHLSNNTKTAQDVGKRHGAPILITILAEKMFEDGYEFYLSDNKVWLTDYVPTKYIHNIDLFNGGL